MFYSHLSFFFFFASKQKFWFISEFMDLGHGLEIYIYIYIYIIPINKMRRKEKGRNSQINVWIIMLRSWMLGSGCINPPVHFHIPFTHAETKEC